MPEMQPRRYQIPTHLKTPDKIDLPLFGITVSLTMRQGVCFLLGGSLVFHLWQGSFGLIGLLGLLLHWIVPFLLAFATYVIAVHTISGSPSGSLGTSLVGVRDAPKGLCLVQRA